MFKPADGQTELLRTQFSSRKPAGNILQLPRKLPANLIVAHLNGHCQSFPEAPVSLAIPPGA